MSRLRAVLKHYCSKYGLPKGFGRLSLEMRFNSSEPISIWRTMASAGELIEELIGLLEKAQKTKPKETKARIDLHKKSNAKVKELQEATKKTQAAFTTMLDEQKEALYAALGMATSEVRLRDREVVRGLKDATKCNEAVPRPKGWEGSYDKAFKIIADWDPKAGNADGLADAIKQLKAASKSMEAWYASYRKQGTACNEAVKAVEKDLNEISDERAKGLIQPYIDKYRQVLADYKRS